MLLERDLAVAGLLDDIDWWGWEVVEIWRGDRATGRRTAAEGGAAAAVKDEVAAWAAAVAAAAADRRGFWIGVSGTADARYCTWCSGRSGKDSGLG